MVLFPEELENRFTIEDHVGEGSYGMIYKVIKKSSFYLGNNKMYAMKVITRNNNSRWKDIEIEMQVLSFVNPYKLHLDCFFVKDDKFFMIIDYCQNGTLLKAINDMEFKQTLFKEDDIWKYFIQICFGLESLHYNDFIHRDLHLQNILLDINNNIKIADFGISRYLGTRSIKGVEAIRSPRTRSGGIQTKESDIWAVGYCLYYLCTLKEYVDDDDDDINLPSMEISYEYSEILRSFVDRCLKKDRSERPTIIDILTDKFIVDKTRELMIDIPQTSIMKTASLQIELSTYKSGEIESLNLQLKSELSECRNKIANQNSEIQQLKVKIADLKNIIIAKGNDIETFRLKAVEISKLLEKRKGLNEKQLVEVKKSIRDLIADAERIKKMLDYSEQDLNVKEPETAQIEILNAQNLMDKRSKILKSSNNSAELENEFRSTCSVYQNHSTAHDESVAQAYQDYFSTYHQKTSLFNLFGRNQRVCNLLIYNTETETQEFKVLQTPLDQNTCITQLPNGKLFCFGSRSYSAITLLIDVKNDCRVKELPSGTACLFSSAIYFNNNVYCFGGEYDGSCLTLSRRFDLDRNKWNELTPLPKADSYCNSIIFNGSILISGWKNKNLWRYSIDNNSFTTIPYDFAEKKTKILINAERLYLIECENGSMYESEIGSDSAWRRINNSIIDFFPPQTYCEYNKGGIYIGLVQFVYVNRFKYLCFKFNLNKKRLNKLFENDL